MRALVIQHDHVSPPGPVGDRLEARMIDVELHQIVPEADFDQPGVPARFPEVGRYDLVVVMGSPWSVYDEERIGSWVVPEAQLLRDADASGVPVLGICFGGQLLSQAHGGRVERSSQPEVGWVSIQTDDEQLVPHGPWFQWHFDRWVMPPGAREVARTEVSSQAYVLRRNLAVQFHPELTSGMLHGWLDNGGDVQAIKHGFDPEQMYADTVAEDPASRARAYALVDAFLDRIARP